MIESGIASFVLLLMAAAAVAILVRRLPIPYVSALAVVSLVDGTVIGFKGLQLTPSLILFGLVPGLLFEAAYNHGRPRGMSMKTQTAVSLFWDYVAFVLNSVIFLLIGISVPLTTLLDQGWVVLGAAVVVLLARAATVYGVLGTRRHPVVPGRPSCPGCVLSKRQVVTLLQGAAR